MDRLPIKFELNVLAPVNIKWYPDIGGYRRYTTQYAPALQKFVDVCASTEDVSKYELAARGLEAMGQGPEYMFNHVTEVDEWRWLHYWLIDGEQCSFLVGEPTFLESVFEGVRERYDRAKRDKALPVNVNRKPNIEPNINDPQGGGEGK